MAKLDAQLCDIKELSIRDGLHVYGQSPDEETMRLLAAASGAEAAVRASAECERAALIAALDARRVAPGPAGAPSRGRADVLPTGRNLTSIDPRAIPTRTAAAIGVRAADEVVRRYLQDHGEPPRALVIDLWASASLRTGGDDLAQALCLPRRTARLGQVLQPRHRRRDHAAGRARPAAHRRDPAHLRPVPRHLRGADRAVRYGGATGRGPR